MYRERRGGTKCRSCASWASGWGRPPCTRTSPGHSPWCWSGWDWRGRTDSQRTPSTLFPRSPRRCASGSCRTRCRWESPGPSRQSNIINKVITKKATPHTNPACTCNRSLVPHYSSSNLDFFFKRVLHYTKVNRLYTDLILMLILQRSFKKICMLVLSPWGIFYFSFCLYQISKE